MAEWRRDGIAARRGAAAALGCLVSFALAALPSASRAEEPAPPPRPSHNLFGITGLIDMPSAEMQPDGQLSLTAGYFGGYLRNTLTAQILPGVEAAFRYSVLEDLEGGGNTLYDRSFDVKLRLIGEGPGWPSVVLGFQDFLGTGIYSGEYLAATKQFFDGDLKVTGGMGWGRFAGTNGVRNPFCFDDNRFCSREADFGAGGTVNFGDFFSGDEIGFFGGLEWRTPIRDLVVKAEYSDDAYRREQTLGDFSPNAPVNFGVEYHPLHGVEIGAYYMYGSEFGVRLTLSGNPFRPLADFDTELPARPVRPRPQPMASSAAAELAQVRESVSRVPASIRYVDAGLADVAIDTKPGGLRWATATLPPSAGLACPDDAARALDAEYGMIDAVTFRRADGAAVCTVALRPAGQEAIRRAVREAGTHPTGWFADAAMRAEVAAQLAAALDADRVGLFGIDLGPRKVAVYIENRKFRSTPQAIGRTARALTETMPPSVELFEIIPVEGSLPVVSVMLERAAIEADVGRPDAARSTWLSARVEDAPPPDWSAVGGTLDQFPRPSWSVNPYTPVSFFDPDQPLRVDLSVIASGGLEVLPGLSANAAVSKRLIGNLDDIRFDSNSDLPRVRSDIARYLDEGDPGIQRLTLDYVTKLDDAVYGRLSAGLLEGMYGGVSAEVLWKPARQSWGLGGEINWVQQRDFDQLFGFRDYDIVTGHASLYWNTGWNGMSVQIDAGRYLAGDWGGTFTLKRRFSNGWELGAFATFTDVPFDEFGEGSFDKGIILTIPLGWTLPFETRSEYSAVIRPLTRDGGQRLSISNRLYPVVEDMGREDLRGSWQGFWK